MITYEIPAEELIHFLKDIEYQCPHFISSYTPCEIEDKLKCGDYIFTIVRRVNPDEVKQAAEKSERLETLLANLRFRSYHYEVTTD